MSISGTLSNAFSGLSAAARAAEVVSANVANAQTPGYGRRQVNLSAVSIAGQGAGVRVDGVVRFTNTVAIADRRSADAEYGLASTIANASSRIDAALGQVGEDDSLAGKFDALEQALISASSRPDLAVRQQNLLGAAQDVATFLNRASTDIQNVRMDADKDIGTAVATLNSSLLKISELNKDIRNYSSAGADATALMDQRQLLIDQISEIVPVRILPRDHNQIAILTQSGGVLLDGKPAQFGFTSVGLITPEMTLAAGGLSGLSLNGELIDTNENSAVSAGSLAALFDVRDRIAPDAQAEVDAIARNLVERFQSPALDATLAAGDAGLFTDSGLPLSVADEVGLASRLAINAAVDPDQGGSLSRLRDGIGATALGPPSDPTLLNAMAEALRAFSIPNSGGFTAAPQSIFGLVDNLASSFGANRLGSETEQSFASSRLSAFQDVELAGGVDTDYELQRLLLVEQAFAANARVISAVDEMLDRLMEM